QNVLARAAVAPVLTPPRARAPVTIGCERHVMLDVSTLNACASRLEVNLALRDKLLGVHQPRIHLQKRVRSERQLAMEVSALGEVVTDMSLRTQEHQSRP